MCIVFGTLGTIVAIHKNLESAEFLKGVRQGMSTNVTEYLQCKIVVRTSDMQTV